MYHVEVLPNTSSSHVTPGWTYVPDQGFDPAKAAIAPSLGRKRGIRDPARTDVSSRRTNAIVRHLAELDRENHRDVTIPIPVKQKDAVSGKATRGKVTSNVRRILQSQKTFRNYLDDEEAALAQAAASGAGGPLSTTTARPSALNKITKPSASSSRRSSTPATIPRPEASTSRLRKESSTGLSLSRMTSLAPTDDAAATSTSASTPAPSQSENQQNQETADIQLIKSKYDNDPLLRSYIPSAPSERIMQALLSEPPLTYNASRAGPPTTGKAPRHFCCICGYWGKIRCRNCHQRTCGVDCYKVHEESRCGAFF